MSTQHTPGPWHTTAEKGTSKIAVRSADGSIVAIANPGDADAISAVPDMCEALKEMVRMYELDWANREAPYYVAACAAIAKAERKS